MDIQANIRLKKYQLIDRLMQIGKLGALEEVESTLVRIEMESRAAESEQEIENGQVISLEEFSRKSREWLTDNTK